MIQIIAGGKGKGKTKILLDKVNTEVAQSKGSIVYLDKNTKHMYDLHKKVSLINVKDYCVETHEEFLGFICGIISQDHDLQKVFLDCFLNISCIEDTDISYVPIIEKLDVISSKFDVDFIISMSVDAADMPESIKEKVIVAL